MRPFLFQIELWYTAIYASILLILPFRVVKKLLLGASFDVKTDSIKVSTEYLLSMSHKITRLKEFFPWRYQCFQQALTARIMLNRRKQQSILFLGSKYKDEDMLLHSWISCKGLVVTGFPDVESYHVIQSFN